jgi:transglycosylase-like protein with SLT domain
MGRELRLIRGLGLACVGMLLLWGPGELNQLASTTSLPGSQPLNETAPSTPAGTEALPLASLEPPAGEPDTSLSQSLPVAAKNKVEKQAPLLARSESSKRLEELIKKYAAQTGVDENLVWAVIRQESGFNPQALSPKGAMGLMQLMPDTAALMGVQDPFDVKQNIAGGIRYLQQCLARFDQDVNLALAAYNAGPGNVVKYQGCPPFPETRQYVAAVLEDYAGPPRRQGLRLPAPEPAASPEVVEEVRPAGLQWHLATPVVKVPGPQLRLRPPQWHDFSWPGRLQAMAARSPGHPSRPTHLE